MSLAKLGSAAAVSQLIIAAWPRNRTRVRRGPPVSTFEWRSVTKLCRFGAGQHGKAEMILDREGRIRDPSSVCADFDPETLGPAGLAKLAAIDLDRLPFAVPGSAFPIARFRNSSASVSIIRTTRRKRGWRRQNRSSSSKAMSAISGPSDNIIQPRDSTKLDWEVELGVVIGANAQYVRDDEESDYVAGHCVVNRRIRAKPSIAVVAIGQGQGLQHFRADRALARHQVRSGGPSESRPLARRQWHETSVGKYQDDDLRRSRNRVVSQPLVATGTPPGVGMALKPEPVWLKPRDVVELGRRGL